MLDFALIGAARCGTSRLAAQLRLQDGVRMSAVKEPNYFGDDAVYARGPAWLRGLFPDAGPGDLLGEASTYYTQAPRFPRSAERLARDAPEARLIYVVRDPLERIVSHYLHLRTFGRIRDGLEAALLRDDPLVSCGLYAEQIAPYVRLFGSERIFLTSLERFASDPDSEFGRLGRFLGAPTPFRWRPDLRHHNASRDRHWRVPGQRLLIEAPLAAALRRALVPKGLRRVVRRVLRVRRLPALSPEARSRLAPRFAADRARLAAMFPGLDPDTLYPAPWA